MLVTGPCVACKALISYSPSHVPSIRVRGEKEPLCRACHAEWNRIHRVEKGLPPEKLHPQAYEPEVTS